MSSPTLSVIVFAFNEETNIAPVLGELVDWLRVNEPGAEVIFIDDGSQDRTAEAAERALAPLTHTVLRHPMNLGIGAALKTGVAAARAPFVTFLPADGQIPPSAISTLTRASEGADVVLSVYERRDDGLHRKVLSFGARALIFALHGVRLRSDGPYLFRRSLFDPSQLAPDTFFLNFEFPLRALGAGLVVRTVTVPCRKRLSGQSKSAGLGRILGVGKDLASLRARRLRDIVALSLGR
ncbi:MAG: glycosyltransferase family 2 protein [Polyangiaceae bacterium]|nr:glycosyltransferase family 2 protein [Polyangiaceae bacterium]